MKFTFLIKLMTRNQTHKFYLFGLFRMDVTERILFGASGVVPLTLKAFDILMVLVENSGHVLGKTELMERVWPDSFVEENNLAQHIAAIRKALRANDVERNYIETVPRRGYRFVADVEERLEAARRGTVKVQASGNERQQTQGKPSMKDVVMIGRAIDFK